MKLRMNTESGPVIIDSAEVTQFYPDSSIGLTRIETLSATGETDSVLVSHSFLQVSGALIAAWRADKQGGEAPQ